MLFFLKQASKPAFRQSCHTGLFWAREGEGHTLHFFKTEVRGREDGREQHSIQPSLPLPFPYLPGTQTKI